LTPAFWHFHLPGIKKIVGKKNGHNNHPPQKKVLALPFMLARWRQKKKVGVEQETVAQVILDSA
jgi:hypothetical protein